MDSMLGEFERLKFSALNKSLLLNEHISDITLGPDSSINTNIAKTKSQVNHGKRNSIKKRNDNEFTENKSKDSPVQKSLAEIEARRKDDVQTSVQSRLEKINNTTRQLQNSAETEYKKRRQYLIAEARKQEDMMIKVLEEHDRKACDHLQQLQINYQKQADERSKRNLELQQREKQRQLQANLMTNLNHQQDIFCSLYQDVVNAIKSCNNVKTMTKILTDYPDIKALPESMEKIRELYKSGKITSSDLKLADGLIQQVKKLKDSIIQQIILDKEQAQNRTNLDHIQDDKAREFKLEKKEAKAEIPSSPSKNVASRQKGNYGFASSESVKRYIELQEFLKSYENNSAQIVSDPNLKKFKFSCQKAVNIPLNAISSQNSQHLFDKYQRLSNLLSGKNVEAGGTYVCASQHPQGIAFCTNLLAKKFVLQGDLMVSSNPESAFYFAAVLVALWVDFPDFGKLILAHFYKEAPYLVPMYPPMMEGQTTREYYESLGFHYTDDVVEKQDKFLKRMSGIMRLYSAVMITKLKRGQHGPHPHGLKYGWNWIANILNLDPSMDITATVIHDFLEVAGSAMLAAYDQQFRKILIYIIDVFLPRLKKVDSGGPMTRLEVLMKKIRCTGQIEPPKGRLPEGYW